MEYTLCSPTSICMRPLQLKGSDVGAGEQGNASLP